MTEKNIENIIKQYSPLVRSICFRMTWNSDISDDAYQETWIEVLKSIKSFHSQSQLSTWIYKIAFRTILRLIKKEKAYSARFISKFIESQAEEIKFAAEIEDDSTIKASCNRCLTGFLYCLSKEDRMLYVLRDIGELEYNTIAGIIEDTPANLRQRTVRIRRRLKNIISNECILYNPNANCKCRNIKRVKEMQLDKEFERFRREMDFINIYKIADSILPTIDILKERCGELSHCSPVIH